MEKTKISALILDYGGVISKPQNPDCISRMCQILGQDIDDFMDVYRSTRAGYDNGRLSAEAYWRTVVQRMGREPNDDVIEVLIQQDVEGWTEVNQAMLAFIAQSRTQLHKLAIISNMTRETLVYMTEHFQWLTIEESHRVLKNKGERKKIEEELADIVLYILDFCNSYNINLSSAALEKLKKAAKKYPIPLINKASRSVTCAR